MLTPAPLRVAMARHGPTGTPAAILNGLMDQKGFGGVFPLTDMIQEEGQFSMQSLQKGKKYLFLSVTHYFVGEVVDVNFTDIVITKVSWVPETGTFSEVMQSGNLAESQSMPANLNLHLNTATLVAAIDWPHNLPGGSGGRRSG